MNWEDFMNDKRLEVVRPSTVDASVFDGDLKLENAKLRERLRDLDAQVQRLQSGRVILPHEEQANREMAEQWRAMTNEQNAIALFMRENFKDEIAAGQHTGFTLSALVIKYLAELKQLKAGRV